MRAPLALLPLLLIAAPAWAGQRATYSSPDGKDLIVTITDDGNGLVRSEGDEQYGILRDGSFYLVGKEEGKLHVARIEDMAAAFDQVMPPVFKEIFSLATKDRPKSKLRIEPAGNRTVGGVAGQAWRIYGMDDDKPNQPSLNVLTRDPKMAAVGKAMEQFMVGSMVAFVPLLGEAAGEMVTDIRAVFALGAPLDMEGKFKLKSLETVAVPAAEAALPAKPDTVAEIVAQMQKQGTASAEPAK